jgi:AsmA protein
VLLIAAAVLALTVALLRPWPVRDAAARAGVIARLSAARGFSVKSAGTMAVRLAPHPVIEIKGLAMSGLGGAVSFDADRLEGRLSIASLLRGALDVDSVALDHPTMVVDVDRITPLATAIFDASSRPAGTPGNPLRLLQTQGLILRSAVVRLLSSDPGRDMVATGLSVSWACPNDLGTATLSGTATLHGIRFRLRADLSAPGRLSTKEGALASARLESPVLDISFNGMVSAAGGYSAVGRLSAATRDLQAFLRAIGTPAPQLAAIGTASVNGKATISTDTLSIADARLELDSMGFDGALAVHRRPGRPGLAGTFATDRIDLDPFLRALPTMQLPGGGWSDAPLDSRPVADDEIDLRISASHAKVRGLRFEDGSLSMQSGNGRMELSLGEAHAYDGLLKGRVWATAEEGATELHADLNVSRLDLAKLMKDFALPRTLAGTATGHLSLAGRGGSPRDIVASLAGHGQFSIRDGAVTARTAEWIAPSFAAATVPWLSNPRRFESASVSFDARQGVAWLSDGWVLWPDARADVTGTASVLLQQFNLQAQLSPVDDDAASDKTDTAAFALTGPWRHPRLAPLNVHGAGGEH